jgi:hypothetical protein
MPKVKRHLRSCGSYFPIFLLALAFSGCITAKKTDRFVASLYGNRLPPALKPTNKHIHIISSIPVHFNQVSSSAAKTSHLLPLLVYFQYDYRVTCILNPAIPLHHFTNIINLKARRGLNQKLKGRELELTIEQLPHVYAWDDNYHMVWPVLFYVSWEKLSLQPEIKDMIVSYKLSQKGQVLKTGRISIPDNQSDRRVGMFEFTSWKRLTTAYISRYNHDITQMSRSFADELMKEL